MNNLENDWFMNQHYTKEELSKLQKWVNEKGVDVEVKEQNGKYSGFHIMDENMEIDIAGQPTKEDCCNWMKRLGFNVINL